MTLWPLVAVYGSLRLGIGILVFLNSFYKLAKSPKRALVLESFGRDVAPFGVADSELGTTLSRKTGQQVDHYAASKN